MSKETDIRLAEKYFEESETLFTQAKYEKSMKLSKQASTLYEKWGAWKDLIAVGNNIAKIYCHIGKYEQAVTYMEGVLKMSEIHFGERHPITLNCLNSMGLCHDIFRNSEEALVFFQKALSIWRSDFEIHPQMALVNNNIAGIYSDLEDFDLSVLHYQEALRIHQKYHGNEDGFVASVLGNLGMCLGRKGDYKLGIIHCKKSLDIKRKIYPSEHPTIASAHHYLARTYLTKADYANALPHYQESIRIKKKILGRQHPDVVLSIEGIGICLFNTGEYDQAIAYFHEVLEISRELFGDQNAELARSFLNIGRCYAYKENYDLALEYLQQGLILLNPNFSDSNFYQNPAISKTYNYQKLNIFRYLFETKVDVFSKKYREQTKNPKDLQASLEAAIVIAEFIAYQRQSHKMEGSKHVLIKNAAELYDFAIERGVEISELYETLSVIPQYPEFTHIPYTSKEIKSLTFDFSEQCKAVLLLSNLKDNEAKTIANIPNKLLEREKNIVKKLSDLDNRMNMEEAKGDKKNEDLFSAIQKEYLQQRQVYDQLIAWFEKEYPEYYQLKYSVSTATVQDLQLYLSAQTTPQMNLWATNGKKRPNNSATQQYSRSAILSYHIAEEQIYIFVITSNEYKIVKVSKPKDFSKSIEKLQNAIQLGHIENFIQCSTQLFESLLRPVWSFLQSANKLIIIPHGELYYLPFDVLLNQHQITDFENFEKLSYLIRDFDISYHYSATLLLHSHQRQQQMESQADSFFGFAPIQFGGENDSTSLHPSKERNNLKKQGYVVKSDGNQKEKNRRRILKSSGSVDAALVDLEETELEVKEVYELFEQQGKEAIALFYDQANKKNLQQYIGDYKYVLISTHGFLKEAGNNILSGIHLAPEESGARTQESGTTDDYILHTSETYHLRLNADLVVLSSCESGIGELKTGEGMMALNRGFLYAGASNIVYSLFKVPQDSTSQLTQALFRHILKGESYASALRKAKLELIEDEMMEPMDWAGFALVGG
ncbi:MAG: CHAT domain-containing tetratricopeptide repeat protein [Chitinophagales bacterium]